MIDLSIYASPLFSEAYRRILEDASGISEPGTRYPAAAGPSVRERIVRCIWFDQSLATDRLRTDDGQKLRVLSPGWWNLEAGPDFRNAALRIGSGPVAKGDVKVHLQSSLWRTHGHQGDPRYNGVILHVALWNDSGNSLVTTAAGANVPQLTLEPYLQSPVAELSEAVDPAEYPESSEASAGRCHALLADGKVTFEWLERFLDHAGDQRIADKARRLAARATGDDDQLLYSAIAEGLGYKRNKAPALELTRRLSLAALRERVAQRPSDAPAAIAIEALLFGAAGLLPDPCDDPRYDEAARRHIGELRALWTRLGADLAESALDAAQWSFDGTRPANFPTRRIAALARFVARHLDEGIGAAIRQSLGPTGQGRLAPAELADRRARLLDLFLSLSDPFWGVRSLFHGKAAARPTHLVGTDRAHTIVIDCLLPALLCQARRDNDRPFEELLHQLYASYPKLPSTSVTRFMAHRLFGKPDTELKLLRSARRQQGLYQVYTDFCDSEQGTCTRCPLVRVLEA